MTDLDFAAMFTPKCETCGTYDNIVGCHSSSLGPFSISSCKTCLEHHAEPTWAVEQLLMDGDDLCESVTETIHTFVNGQYLSIRSYIDSDERAAELAKQIHRLLVGVPEHRREPILRASMASFS